MSPQAVRYELKLLPESLAHQRLDLGPEVRLAEAVEYGVDLVGGRVGLNLLECLGRGDLLGLVREGWGRGGAEP